jgi:GrpB-like predicted nucleotidyltransferase (UPF0157 family)
MSELVIGPYPIQPPVCVESDPGTRDVAQQIAQRITATLPALTVEPIGSTAIPGCAGKGIVDLMVLYPKGYLEAAKEVLRSLGFQQQTVGHIHPETRPMRVGSLKYRGRLYRLHLHVIAADSPEVTALRAFRECLRVDPELVAAYVARKKTILAAGVIDCRAYTEMKSAFIQEVLSSAGAASSPHPPWQRSCP